MDQVLVLIHTGGQLDEGGVLERWRQLKASTRKRLVWLIVSGAGMSEAASTEAKVHFLRYPLSGDELRQTEVRACLRGFLRSLEELPSGFEAPDWRLLYPSDNVALATLLVLLSTSQFGLIPEGVQNFMRRIGIETLQRQYLARTELAGLVPELKREDFRDVAEIGAASSRSEALRNEIRRVLGEVPD